MYVTLDDLYEMIKDDEDFVVVDAKSGEDLTRSVLTQIIFERESKATTENLLPTTFLKQLIRYYDNNVQSFMPQYLESMMQMYSQNQEQWQSYFEKAGFKGSLPPQVGDYNPFSNVEDLAKQNMELFEQTFRMFTGMGSNKDDK